MRKALKFLLPELEDVNADELWTPGRQRFIPKSQFIEGNSLGLQDRAI